MGNDVTIREGFWEDLKADARTHVHLVMIATKPDIIKQAPLYLELKKRGEFVLLGHTGQHYDFNLSGGMQEEFGIVPDFNLNIDGPVHQKVAQIIGRLGDLLVEMKTMGKIVIPYVHGDTMTAMAVSNTAYMNEFASVHVEAGIRTLTPKREIFEEILQGLDWEDYFQKLQVEDNWQRGSIEPYPEQFNTRTTEPATGLFCAPTEQDRDSLIREGFREDRIKVVGNTVYDATMMVMEDAKSSKIFETYPALRDGFIRFCIHRRENCASRERFTAIFDAMEQLVNEGEHVLLISLYQTKTAVEEFGLASRLAEMEKKENFVHSDVWPFYTDVIAAMQKASVCATDSGSMQEEMNILGIPCVTLRFGSDRAETVLAGANIIAPPIDGKLIADIIKGAKNHEGMKAVPNLYGTEVSKRIVDEVLALLVKESLFSFEQDRLKLSPLPPVR